MHFSTLSPTPYVIYRKDCMNRDVLTWWVAALKYDSKFISILLH